jgi:transposase
MPKSGIKKDLRQALRKIGFNKDNKASNPQIMIGLLVNDLGFPISYQVLAENKFEDHTLMPSILALKKKYKIKQMTIVTDSAMISDKNVEFLKTDKLLVRNVRNLNFFSSFSLNLYLTLRSF